MTKGNPVSFENRSQEKGKEEISHTDLFQSCACYSLNNTFLSGKSRKVIPVDAEDDTLMVIVMLMLFVITLTR